MNKVWCLKKNFWLHINTCLVAQTNPNAHCPKQCSERKPPDDRTDEEKFWPKEKEKKI